MTWWIAVILYILAGMTTYFVVVVYDRYNGETGYDGANLLIGLLWPFAWIAAVFVGIGQLLNAGATKLAAFIKGRAEAKEKRVQINTLDAKIAAKQEDLGYLIKRTVELTHRLEAAKLDEKNFQRSEETNFKP